MSSSIFSAAKRVLGAALAGSLFLATGAFAESPAPVVKKPAVENPTHILFVGNS